MDPFATVEDLEARWRTLSADERARAAVLLADESASVAALCGASGVDVEDAAEPLETNLRKVVCNRVRRVMDAPRGLYGANQQSQGAGPYTASASFSQGVGNAYLTREERKLLGIGRMRAGTYAPQVGYGAPPQTWGGGGDAA